ncbi:Pheromone B beta 1 receptor [Ceratobasidium theobromae]|uniref:Pheromone B beta 1 receptor n=1 Tax=Ceratobasidium theobromae TaxID=1582974 RepID=A0A5N5QJR0_9AGAM|nr:Pheromone B beta 1 receptor [Ceratobasidium theobromae]
MGAEMPTISFLCAVLVLVLLPLHWRTCNIAMLSLIIWLAISNIVRGMNATIWIDNTIVKYKIWCTRLIVGANIALPSSVFCICRFLAQVASPHNPIPDASEKRRRAIFDLAACVGLPIIIMALYYIIQQIRFTIYEGFGCGFKISTYPSVVSLFIFDIPPICVSLGALIYAAISLRWFVHRRAQVREALQSSQSGLTTTLYLRFIIHSIIQMFYTTAITLYFLIDNTLISGLQPWTNWDDVHSDLQHINQVHRADKSPFSWRIDLLSWYVVPASSVLFFVFFGLGQEAKSKYVKFFRWVFQVKPKPVSALPINVPRAGHGGPSTFSLSFGIFPVVTAQPEATAQAVTQEIPLSINASPTDRQGQDRVPDYVEL